ncbi:UDP-glucose 4-epimerase [gamma proteobacterium NOR5-3]|nr:UDP-glucose 4-epimerase [gamma proteobacterium NOR5-3]
MPVLAERGCRLSAQYCRGAVSAPGDAQLSLQRRDFSAGQADLDLEGVDAVFHLAGIAHQRADAQAYQHVNVDASLALAQRARAAGVTRFVFISSVKALAAQRDAQGALLPVVAASNPYAQSKALAEQGLQNVCRDSGMQLFIVRPALVYSKEASGHLRWLRRWAAWHLPAPPSGGGRSMIALDDLVRVLALLVDASLSVPVPALMTVTDEQIYSTRRLHAAICAAMEREPWLPSPPAFVWRSLCRLWDALRGEKSGCTWERMTADECYRSSGLESLDFQPSLSFEASLGVPVHGT